MSAMLSYFKKLSVSYARILQEHGVYAPWLQAAVRLLLSFCFIVYYLLMPDVNKIYPLNLAVLMAVIFIIIHCFLMLYVLLRRERALHAMRYGNWLDLCMAHMAWLCDPVQPSPLMSFISIAVIGNGMQLGVKVFRENAPVCLCFSIIIFTLRTLVYGFSIAEMFLSAFLILMMSYAYLLLTNIQKLKKNIESHKNKLEETVMERTSDLQKSNELLRQEVKSRKNAEREARQKQAQLLQATKMASLGTLIAGLAHEINNPVAIINMNISNVRKFCAAAIKIMDECFRDNMEGIVCNMKYENLRTRLPIMLEGLDEGITRVTKLVEDLRTYARQQPGVFFEPMDISVAIAKALRLTNNIIKKSTRNFAVDICDPIPAVNGDIHKIEQVIINLITNACQALENQEQGISIKAGFITESGMVFVSVTDEGRGMTPAVIERIKTPFFTTRRHKDGTGLGLSISDTIIGEHGGALEFESAPGKGTTARITLPFYVPAPITNGDYKKNGRV